MNLSGVVGGVNGNVILLILGVVGLSSRGFGLRGKGLSKGEIGEGERDSDGDIEGIGNETSFAKEKGFQLLEDMRGARSRLQTARCNLIRRRGSLITGRDEVRWGMLEGIVQPTEELMRRSVKCFERERG